MSFFSNLFKPEPQWPAGTRAHAMAIVCGLTKVNPGMYYGWRGDCPGCDVDARALHGKFLQRHPEAPAKLILNAGVRKRPVFDSLLQAFDILTADDDLLFFYFSGHGGQEVDLDGDEADGKDETLCFYDGPVIDDDLRRLWLKAPPRLRIVFASDSCNSGTASRMARFTNRPRRMVRKLWTPRSLRKTIPDGFKGRLLHLAGCPDGMSSYGSTDGGVFTREWLRATSQPGGPVSWRDSFVIASGAMPRNQTIMMEEFGESFADREVLT